MKKYVNGEYVEMTKEEIAHIEELLKKEAAMPEPTIEEQILTLQNALIISKTSGGGITTITDSSENRIKNLKIFGKSTQMRTTGTQLFDARNVLKSQIEKGILTINHDGNIVLNGKFDDGNKQFSITLQPGTYTLSGDDNAIWHIISSNGDGIFKQTLVVDVETTYNCYIDGNTYNNHITMPMINIGDSAKPYEPYTGGKPSPSPNYPQKIKTTEIKSIKISGENLLNGVRNTFVPLFLKKGTKLTLIAEEPSPHGVNIVLKDVDGGNLWLSLTNTELKKSMILSKDIKGYEARIVKGNYSMVIGDADQYKPYEFNEKILSHPIILAGIPVKNSGNYTDSTGQQWVCDEIDLEHGERINRIKKESLVGKQWIKASDNRFYTKLNDASKNTGHCLVMCNYYKGSPDGQAVSNDNTISLYKDSSNMYPSENWLYVRDNAINTVDEMQQKMNELNVEVMYITAEPTKEKLTQNEIDAFKLLYTYYPTTVITADGGEVAPDIKVAYIADTKNYIDQKFETIEKIIITTQKALL